MKLQNQLCKHKIQSKYENNTIVKMMPLDCMFLLYHSYLQIFNKIKDQLLCHQTNVKISNFCDFKLRIKNKFIDRIVNNIQFE